jgi:hypothetical protein
MFGKIKKIFKSENVNAEATEDVKTSRKNKKGSCGCGDCGGCGGC